jgi:ribosomal-protein-serine acetyltransferase
MEELLNIIDELETQRTILKKYNAKDGEIFFAFVGKNKDRMLNSFPIILSSIHDEFSVNYFIKRKIEEWDERSAFNFAIWHKENGNYIGHISIKNIDWMIPRGELAYIISEEYEGKGIMSEAVKTLIRFGFSELLLSKLFLRILTDNEKSIRLAEKCGFSKEGLLRKDHRTFMGELVDLYYYGLTKEDYQKISKI